MATLKQYALKLWQVQRTVSARLGADIAVGSLDQRASMLSTDVTLAMLIKCLTDNGVITDTQLNATLAAAQTLTYPPLPPQVGQTSDQPVVPDPDLGA